MSTGTHVVCPHCGGVNRIPQGRDPAAGRCGRCEADLFSGSPIEADAARFQQQLQRSDVPLLVDFWAPWCAPCRMMAPAFEQAARALEPDFRLLKINTEIEQQIAMQYGIRSIPTLALFHAGREVARQAGAMDAGSITQWARQQH